MGFKTGPASWLEGQEIVLKDQARMCELWFRIDALKQYPFINMLEWLIDHKVAVGLHYWGMVGGRLKPNFGTRHIDIREESIQQVRSTIQIARDFGCVYVNIHPGGRYLEEMDLDARSQKITDDPPTDRDEWREVWLDNMKELSDYALRNKTMLTVETLPGMESVAMEIRDKIYFPDSANLEDMKILAKQGVKIANDISHTMAGVIPKKDEATENKMWQVLEIFTGDTAKQTGLVHVNTLSRPYNGTDSHNGLLDEDFAAGVFPDRERMIKFLSYFRDLNEVYLVTEPKNEMRKNHVALKELVADVK